LAGDSDIYNGVADIDRRTRREALIVEGIAKAAFNTAAE